MSQLEILKERLFPQREKATLFEEMRDAHAIRAHVYTYPFRHIVIDDFLPHKGFLSLQDIFAQTLKKGVATEIDQNRFFHRDMYDVHIHWPQPTLDLPLGYFFSTSYRDFLSRIFSSPLSEETILAFHHHARCEKDQYIHTDYLSGYFAENPLPNGVNPWHFNCTHSARSERGVLRRARALAAIYYLGSDSWKPSLQGETGIFSSKDATSLVRKIAPIRNRLLVFEITPFSWHNFMQTHMASRDSVAQWFFLSEEDNKKRFPQNPITDFSVGY